MSADGARTVTPDPWDASRRHTSARVALGRAGGSLPTGELLKFSLDHAVARDAVHWDLDVERLTSDLSPIGLPVVGAETLVHDRPAYLQRPDLGRRLSDASRVRLSSHAGAPTDVAIIIADGLSGIAPQRHAAPLLTTLVPALKADGLGVGPLVVIRFARVAIQDEIGAALGARSSLILIGERPGLGAPDGLGAYLIFNPRIGATDADRNCVSNIRPAGLPIERAAGTIRYLVTESLRRTTSGVALKDERAAGLL
jgi:ethanolamine ammonia-lyase small subunit